MDTVKLVVVGSVGLDNVETVHEAREGILGGSASYACATASFYTKVGMVGVVGTDFPSSYHALYEQFGICTEGLQVVDGKTFHWAGIYEENMDNRTTIRTDLNVFEHFSPHLPENYRKAPYLFLANISPELQLHVLDQIEDPKFILVDTMDLWINVAQEPLREVIKRVTMLTLNESEAHLLTDKHSLITAAKELLSMGPEYVLIKKGANGSILFGKDGSIFMLPAYPVEVVHDPTGAGDSFAGALMGYLSREDQVDAAAIRRAILHASVVASYGVEQFSLDRLQALEWADIEKRADAFVKMTQL